MYPIAAAAAAAAATDTGGSYGAVPGHSARSDVDRRDARRQVPRERVESVERRLDADARRCHVWQRRHRHVACCSTCGVARSVLHVYNAETAMAMLKKGVPINMPNKVLRLTSVHSHLRSDHRLTTRKQTRSHRYGDNRKMAAKNNFNV